MDAAAVRDDLDDNRRGPVNSSETIGIIIYKEAFVKFQYSNASAAAVILLAVCTIIGVFYVKHQRAEE